MASTFDADTSDRITVDVQDSIDAYTTIEWS